MRPTGAAGDGERERKKKKKKKKKREEGLVDSKITGLRAFEAFSRLSLFFPFHGERERDRERERERERKREREIL